MLNVSEVCSYSLLSMVVAFIIHHIIKILPDIALLNNIKKINKFVEDKILDKLFMIGLIVFLTSIIKINYL